MHPPRSRLRRLLAALALSAAVAGCGASDPGEEASAPRSAALLDVSSTGQGGVTVHAAFVRYAGLRGTALLDLLAPSRQEQAPGTGCRLLGPDEAPLPVVGDATSADGDTFVELLDAGALTVRGDGDVRTEMPPRSWPALGEVLGGVFYAADLDRAGTERVLRVEAPGDEAPAAELTAELPPVPRLLGVEREGRGLRFRWTPPADDELLVRLEGPRGEAICRVDADGTLHVEPALLARLGGTLRASARRVRVRSVELVGYDEGWVLASSRAADVRLPAH